jgi:hypothetical protein
MQSSIREISSKSTAEEFSMSFMVCYFFSMLVLASFM